MRGRICIVCAIIVSCLSLAIASGLVSANNKSDLNIAEKNIDSNDIVLREGVKYSTDNINHGAILQAWCWSFNTIKEKLPEIKAAGFSSIQTSPIQECRIGEDNQDYSLDLRRWYYTYQPVDFTIGNYQIGTKQELKELCDEAEKYDIDIIVDVVVNHMTSEWKYIKPNMQKKEYFNTNYGINNWQDRYSIVNMSLSGLWDLKTTNLEVQNIVKNFLKECVALGVDGFRYDCAKHIELPEDEGFGSNFWPYVTDNGSKYQLGEVLKGNTARYDMYSKYLNITAAEYGEIMQKCLKDRDFSVNKVLDYRVGNVDTNRIAAWVESHDNFANDEMDSVWMTDEDIKLGWAFISARANTTTIMFNRPLGAGGTDYDSRFPGLTHIGDAGSELYKDDEVVSVNLFKNEMEYEDEYLRNINNGKIIMVERGNRGAVIINLDDKDICINSDTRLKDGEYVNRTDNHNVFSVSNGKISGILPSRSAVVIYKTKLELQGKDIGVEKYYEEIDNAFIGDTLKLKLYNNSNMDAEYYINGNKVDNFNNGKEIIIGKGIELGEKIDLELVGRNDKGDVIRKKYSFIKESEKNTYRIRFYKPYEWRENVYCYLYGKGKTDVRWPGILMRNVYDNVYEVIIENTKLVDRVVFNDLLLQCPNVGKQGFIICDNAYYNVKGICKKEY